MPITPVVECTVSKSTKVLIKGTRVASKLEEPLYAINWLNTKRKWLYGLYGMLAGRLVLKLGARPLFKGTITQHLVGQTEMQRDILLIVTYTSANQFKQLIENKTFQIYSLLRRQAVQKFSFGFAEKEHLKYERNTKGKAYAVHHFTTADRRENLLSELEVVLKPSSIGLFFAGQIAARVVIKTDKETTAPCILDGTLILVSDSEKELIAFINSKSYQSFCASFQSSYVGVLQREL